MLPPRLALTTTLPDAPRQDPTAVPAVRLPAALTHIAPPQVQRGRTVLLDIRGRDLHPDHLATVLRSGKPTAAVILGRQKLIAPTLLQAVVAIRADAPKGSYDVVVVDARGNRSNAVHFEVLH